MKNILKKICNFGLLYIAIAIVFLALMFFSYMLPDYNIRGHAEESVERLKTEGLGYAPFFGQVGATLDTHTDALMLNIALNKGTSENQSVFERAVENSYNDEGATIIDALDNSVHSDKLNNQEYSRYWHGIQVVLRPLLMFFNYSEIRYILMIIMLALLGIVFAMIGKQLGYRYVIVFAITIAFIYAMLIPMSLQYSCMFTITLLGIIAVCLTYRIKKEKYIPYVFFIIGAISTYFDLLTYPLVTLGIPLAITLLFENKKETKLLNLIIKAIELGALWGVGYCLLFFTKWVFASIILHKNAIAIALDTLLFRVNGNEQYPVTRVEVLKNNFNTFFVPIAKYTMIIITGIWAILMIFFRKKISEIKVALPLLCIAILPYLWYIIFAGHSSIHSWFTYRIQAVTVFAILSAMCVTLKEPNNKID